VEVFIENFDKVVNGLEVRQIVVSYVNTDTEVETGVATVNNLEVSKLHRQTDRQTYRQTDRQTLDSTWNCQCALYK